MGQRAVPFSEPGRVPDRPFHVLAGGGDGVEVARAPRQLRRDRGRQRAAGAVRVLRLDARTA